MFKQYILFTLLAGSTSLLSVPQHPDNLMEVKTMAEFDQQKAKGKPMLIDIYAPWCGPCKMMMPIIEEVAKEHPQILFIKMNGDTREFGKFVVDQGVTGYPSFLLFSANGQMIEKFSGSCSKTLFVNKLKKLTTGATTPRGAMASKQVQEPMMPKKKEVITIESRVSSVENANNFVKEVIESKKPVIIQFMMPKCNVCDKISTIIDKLSSDADYNRLQFVQIDYTNKKLVGILPKEPGILILPTYHFIGMKEFEKKKRDFDLEVAIKDAIMGAHGISVAMPKNAENYKIADDNFWKNKS